MRDPTKVDPLSLPKVVPSNQKPDYWAGEPAAGEQLTQKQLEALREAEEREGKKLTVIEWTVRFEGRGIWDPTIWKKFPCPLIVETRLAVKIITPSGHIAWFEKPKKRK